jgi:uncharacterized C2H2 Zn-finger protein
MEKIGDHTWKLYIHYEKCPACGYIYESRQDYTYRMGKWVVELICPQCGKEYSLEKISTRLGPIFGEGSKPEIEWGN